MTRKKQWAVRNKKADYITIAKELGVSPVLARIICNRGVTRKEEIESYLRCSVKALHSPSTLPNIDLAADTILRAIREDTRIRIIGDYDVDGICSTYILQRFFAAMGAHVDSVLPHRIRDGYGISESMVRKAGSDGIGLIVTCDNGIAAKAPLTLAKELGIKAVVTDHHEVPFEQLANGKKHYLFPEAEAVVDPKIIGKDGQYSYPFPDICGAAVAMKLCMYIRRITGSVYKIHKEDETQFWRELESFCAIATVCDVMPLQDENRVMVKRGLSYAPSSGNIGLSSLLDACRLTGKKLTSYHAGFVIGPCLNASGRLDTAQLALRMFQTKDHKEAAAIANKLVELNEERKDMTKKGLEEAMDIVEMTGFKDDRVLVIHLPDCHESLAGIIAGKIRERWYRPAIVFTGHGMLKGSGRSIEAYHMYDRINEHRDLLIKFGGHAMAAGMSIEEENLGFFRKALNADCSLSDKDLEEKILADMVLPPGMLDLYTVRQFEFLEPYGTKNPKPIFMAGHVRINKVKILGKNKNVMKFDAVDEKGNCITLIKFGEETELADILEENGLDRLLDGSKAGQESVELDIIYSPEINEWNGTCSVQYVLKDLRVHREQTP